MGKLTAAKVAALTVPGRYHDGDTLMLNIGRTGSKSWLQRVMIAGKRCDIGLGPWPVVSLATARRRAFENRVAIEDGRDPLAEKHQAKVPTFRDAERETFNAHQARWKNGTTAKHWRATMDRHVLPVLGSMRVDAIGPQDVLRILTPMWTTSPEMGRKLRQRIRHVLRWAMAHGFIAANAAGEQLDGALPTMPRVKEHFRALPYQDVADALETVAASRSGMAAKLAFRLVVLTAVRSGEARGARWDEIDMDARTWTIPADRMKANSEHRVPLSPAAVDLLNEARILNDGSGLCFPSPRKKGRELSNMTMTKVLRDAGLADRTVVHGFRSSFRDWCAETGKPREIAEAALAHQVAGVEGAYFRSDLFERRRRLMDAWSEYVTRTSGAKVVSLRG